MKITEIDRDEALILIRMADAYLRNVYNEYEQMEVDSKLGIKTNETKHRLLRKGRALMNIICNEANIALDNYLRGSALDIMEVNCEQSN